jgi:uncharacterized CHY-type Zn-finger protein
MSRGILYILAIVVVLAVAFGAGEISLRSATCMACHEQQATYAHWMGKKLVADKRGFSHELLACANCHIKGSPEGTVTSRFRGLGHVLTYLTPQIDPRRPQVSGLFHETRVPSENCQYCHLGAVQRKAMLVKDMPKGLKEIGLAMDHRKHVLTRDDTCAKCHERNKDSNPLQADKMVTYTEVNHMACDSCHTAASHAYRRDRILPMSPAQFTEAKEDSWKWLSRNPRWMIGIPTEQSCKRCHNGKIHYKTRIFLADCKTGQDYATCVKCHPLMTKDYFEKYKRERQTTAMNSGEKAICETAVTSQAGKAPSNSITAAAGISAVAFE